MSSGLERIEYDVGRRTTSINTLGCGVVNICPVNLKQVSYVRMRIKYKVAKRANGTKWNEQWMFEFESLDPG